MQRSTITAASEVITRYEQTIADAGSVSNEMLNAFLLKAPIIEEALAEARSEALRRLAGDSQALQNWEIRNNELVRKRNI